MRVSVICIADRPMKLPLLYWSLAAQTHKNWELLVLDQGDGSTPVEEYLPCGPKVPQVRIFQCDRKDDWGQSAKEIAAREHADGDVLMFPNDDAYYVPTALMELVTLIKRGADLAICGWLYDLMGYIPMPPSTEIGHIDVGGFMVRREMFLKVGWPDKSQTGDGKLIASLLEVGANVGTYDRVLYVKN